jgi:hypothetical protein
MADMMLFPKTWEEFEKQYGFHDVKQAYMYGNTRLIPSFRVEQWLDHLDDIKRKEQSQENKISQVAQLFHKKLGETFSVVKEECGFAYVKFTEDGLRMVHSNGKVFTRNDIEDFGFSVDLEDLLTGSAVIINE